jgi:hypothetical protein
MVLPISGVHQLAATVYPLSASIAQVKTDVLTLAIVPDPNAPGQLVTPDTEVVSQACIKMCELPANSVKEGC